MTASQIAEMQQAFTAFKAANDQAVAEAAKFGRENGILKEQVERLNDGLMELEAKFNRKGIDQPSFNSGGLYRATEAKRLFMDILRGKSVSHEDMRAKTLILNDGTRGGYLAPPEYVQEIITSSVEFSPIRSIASIRSTTSSSVMIPKRTSTSAATWVSETGTRSESTNPAFGLVEVRPGELYSMIKVSRQELDDAAFNLEDYMRAEMAEQFGVAEGAGFVSGNGVGKPFGFMEDSGVTSVNSGNASAITADGLIELFYELKEAYLPMSYWVLGRSTLKEVRKLKDGNGQYLWAPGLATGGRPATILDRPYITSVDMPTIAANAFPVAFGDFRRGYQIVDRIEIEVTIDPYKSKEFGIVEFSGRKRVGGQVILAEAIKKLKIAA